MMTRKLNLSRYQFAEIPNDEEGLEFVRQLKTYLNKDRYKIDAVSYTHMTLPTIYTV